VGRKVRTGQIYRELTDMYSREFTQIWRTDASFGRKLKENYSALRLLRIHKHSCTAGRSTGLNPTLSRLGNARTPIPTRDCFTLGRGLLCGEREVIYLEIVRTATSEQFPGTAFSTVVVRRAWK
jgi:hypothetical protein